jgi:glycosyltransferase involved in cell wall biosynthesis
MPKRNKNVICMIGIASYPVDSRIRREAEELEKKGYEVDIICSQFKDQIKFEEFGKIKAYRVQKALTKEEVIKYIIYSSLFMVKAFFKLQKLYLKRKYSIIQIHNMPDHLVFVAIVQKLLKIPIILDIHDLTLELFEEKWPGSEKKLIKKIVKITERISCSFADHIITVTEGCKEKLVQRGVPTHKITLILNTVNEDIFKFRNKDKYQQIKQGAKIIYPGTVAHRFGVHLIVEAMKFVKDKIPGSIFNVYGNYDDSYKSFLTKKIKELELDDNVKLNGELDRDEIPDIVGDSDIGVIPYLNHLYMHLALPTKACEYAALGIPIVCTQLHTVAITFKENSISFVNSEEPEEFADKIIELCLNPELRKERIMEAYSSISKISWRVIGQRYTDLVDRLSLN